MKCIHHTAASEVYIVFYADSFANHGGKSLKMQMQCDTDNTDSLKILLYTLTIFIYEDLKLSI